MLRNLSKLVCLLCIFTSVVEGRRNFKEKIKKCFSRFFPEKPTPPPPPVSCPCNEFSTLESVLSQDGVVIDGERSCKTSSDAISGEVFGIFADPPLGSGFPPLSYAVSFDRLICQSIDAIQSLSSKAEADSCKDVLAKTCESLPLPPPLPASCPCNEFFRLTSFLNQDGVTIDRERSCKTIVGGTGDDVEFGIFADPPPGSSFPPLDYVVSFNTLTCQSIDAIAMLSTRAEADACKDLLVETCDALSPPCPCKRFDNLDDILDNERVVINKELSCVARDNVDDFSLQISASDPDGFQPNFSVSGDENNNLFSCRQFDSIDGRLSKEEFNVCKDLLEDKCDRLNLPPASCPCNDFSTLSSVLNQDGVVIDTESSCKTFFDFDTGDDAEFGIFADPPPGSSFPPLDYVVSFDRLTCQSIDAITFLSTRAEADACKDDLVDTCRKLSLFPPGSCPCDFTNDLLDTFRQDGIIIDREKSCKVTTDPSSGTETLGVFGGNGRNALNYILNSESSIGSCITQGDQLISSDLSLTQIAACQNDLFESCIELKIPPSASLCPCDFTNDLVDTFSQDGIIIDFENSCIFTDDPTGRVGVFGGNGINALSYSLSFDSRGGAGCTTQGDQVNPNVLSTGEIDACKKDLKESCFKLNISVLDDAFTRGREEL